MKKYLVIGNPIDHSLSPKLHNYWIKENNINAIYEKKLLNKNNVQNIIEDLKNNKLSGINVTVPFKKLVISYTDQLTHNAAKSQSVNTIYKKDGKIIGDNTDIAGFIQAFDHINCNLKNKKIFVLGAGGVVPSIILGLKEKRVSEIIISNRSKQKAEDLKKIFNEIKIIDWGKSVEADIIINATSLGLRTNDEINIDYKQYKSKLFYDIIYNPSKTNFLKKSEEFGNQIENGKLMFVYQAQSAFEIWHGLKPKINKAVLDLI